MCVVVLIFYNILEEVKLQIEQNLFKQRFGHRPSLGNDKML